MKSQRSHFMLLYKEKVMQFQSDNLENNYIYLLKMV